MTAQMTPAEREKSLENFDFEAHDKSQPLLSESLKGGGLEHSGIVIDHGWQPDPLTGGLVIGFGIGVFMGIVLIRFIQVFIQKKG